MGVETVSYQALSHLAADADPPRPPESSPDRQTAGMDWGSVPDWFGGIGTTGALLLGLYVLSRDRRSAEQAQMRRLVINRRGRNEYFAVELLNTSDQPFYRPNLVLIKQLKSGRPVTEDPSISPRRFRRIIRDAAEYSIYSFHDANSVFVNFLESRASTERELNRAGIGEGLLVVSFRDALGQRWAIAAESRHSCRHQHDW